MAKKLKKNGFIEGALLSYASILLIKVLGALYSIPFYNIIGDKGGVIYSCAYNIYALFLEISTSGIPIAVSIVVSEFIAQEMYRSKKKTYSLALKIIGIISLISFLIMQIFAEKIGMFFLEDMEQGVTPHQIALAVRTVSTCLLVVPFLSLKRGYLQGHKIISASSTSQIIEQITRIAVVLIGSFIAIRLLKTDVSIGVCIALAGATVGALAAYFYLTRKTKADKAVLNMRPIKGEQVADNSYIIKKILFHCLTIVIITVAESIYNVIDMKMILTGLHKIGYSDEQTQAIASIASTWIPKICMLISALSLGITNSIAPHMAEKKTDGNMRQVSKTLNQAMSGFLLIAIPMGIGLIMLSKQAYLFFYGPNEQGPLILKLAVLVNIVGALVTISCMSVQSIGKGYLGSICTLAGIVVNAGLDLPLIFLFNKLGIPAYLGATTSSILGEVTALSLLIFFIKRNFGFRFRFTLRTLVRIVPGVLALTAVVGLLMIIWPPIEVRSFKMIVQVLVYAGFGGGAYGITVLLDKAVANVVGNKAIDRVFDKLESLRNRKSGAKEG